MDLRTLFYFILNVKSVFITSIFSFNIANSQGILVIIYKLYYEMNIGPSGAFV